jgi:hypothetical protein
VTFNALGDGTYSNCTITVTDTSGNASTPLAVSSFTVDTTPPTLVLPSNITVSINYPNTTAVVTYAAPTATDADPGITITQTAGLGSGGIFPIGVNTETYRATDTAGNFVEASFNVSVSQIPAGQVTFEVVTDGDDGTFNFNSPETQLTFPVTTSGGAGISSSVTIQPGSYTVTITPPSGFGLASVSCSDADSVGNVPGQSATINLASSENVTCTFATLNSRKKTVEVIGQFMNRRADLLLSNGPDGNRQLDRLLAAGKAGGGAGEPGAGFASSGGPINGGSMTGGRASAMGLTAATGPMAAGGMASSSVFAQYGGIDTSRARFSDQQPFDQRMALGGDPFNDLSGQAADGKTGLSPILLKGSNEGAMQLSFSTSLSQMMKFSADMESRRMKSALGAVGVGPEGVPETTVQYSPFDVWVEGHYADFSDARNPNGDSDGHFGVVYLGADYVLSPSILVGALVQYESMDQSSRTGAFDIEGKGWMAGPYATIRLADNLFYQGRAAWGRSDNDISPFLTYTDSFSTNRWLVTSKLIGQWAYDGWDIRPAAEIAYIEDRSDSYTDSLGVQIPGMTVSLGQFTIGPEISRRFAFAGGAVEPRVGLEAIWNFESSDDVADFGGTLAGPQEVRGRVELGIAAQLTDGLTLDLSSSYDGIGSDNYDALTGRAMLRMPLN